MGNPFKFGTIVDGQYFTDRTKELQYVEQILQSENHLVLISPRRFGKSSLVNKALEQTTRKHIVINMQSVTSVQNFASRLMSALFRLNPGEKMKHLMTHFRVVPTVSTNPMTGSVDVSFNPSMNSDVILEDAMELLQKVSTEKNRLIVVLDEFQEIDGIKGFDKQLRSIMQTQQHINYVFLGSQESMMESIFEKKKSPFYHFGQLMRLAKIPYEDFKQYVAERKLTAAKHKEKRLQSELKRLTRSERTHRLCTRAGMLEKFLREPTLLTDDDVMELLTFIFQSEAVQKKLNMLIENRKETEQPNRSEKPC